MKINDKNKNSGDTTKKEERLNNLNCLEYFRPSIPTEYGYIIFIFLLFIMLYEKLIIIKICIHILWGLMDENIPNNPNYLLFLAFLWCHHYF